MDVHCEWGEAGIRALAGSADVFVVVDVLSSCTAVDVATARGVAVYPVEETGDPAVKLAEEVGAALAGPRGRSRVSLSPASFLALEPGSRVVLPSANGATLSRLIPGTKTVLAGCLRNATAVARVVSAHEGAVGVLPAGERWPDGSLRPALEDWLGAGAIIDALAGTPSPEALGAASMFRSLKPRLAEILRGCASGRELAEAGFGRDVLLAAELDVSGCAPVLEAGAYRRGG